MIRRSEAALKGANEKRQIPAEDRQQDAVIKNEEREEAAAERRFEA
jgi:hypothetical protein